MKPSRRSYPLSLQPFSYLCPLICSNMTHQLTQSLGQAECDSSIYTIVQQIWVFFPLFFYKFLGGLLNFLILPFCCCWERRKANIWLSALQGTATFHVSGVCYNTAWDKYIFILWDGCIAWETRPLWEGDIYIHSPQRCIKQEWTFLHQEWYPNVLVER